MTQVFTFRLERGGECSVALRDGTATTPPDYEVTLRPKGAGVPVALVMTPTEYRRLVQLMEAYLK